LLLDHPGIDLNFHVDTEEDSALIRALKFPDVVKLLLDREDIDVNYHHRFGDTVGTALCEAVSCNYVEAAKLLLQRDDIDVNDTDRGTTALLFACRSHCLEIVDLLLGKEDISVNARDVNGYTPLSSACHLRSESDVAIVRSLLSHHNIDPNGVDRFG
jgi:ankyrin repeat protein